MLHDLFGFALRPSKIGISSKSICWLRTVARLNQMVQTSERLDKDMVLTWKLWSVGEIVCVEDHGPELFPLLKAACNAHTAHE